MTEIILTEDGSHTLYVPELKELYHSIHGAVQESRFIFIDNGFRYSPASPLRIFEAGFGTGLNALLTAIESSAAQRKVFYTSVENTSPLSYYFKTELFSLVPRYGSCFQSDPFLPLEHGIRHFR